MAEIKYKIPMVSVRSLLAYAKEKEDGSFSFSLTQKETACISQSTLQDENAVFYQAMRLITDNQFTQPKKLIDSDGGREQLVKNYIERIDIYDPTDDDPDKYRLDVILRTDTTGRSAEEVTTEVEISVRKNTSMGHHENSHKSGSYFFAFLRTLFRSNNIKV